MIYLIYGCYSWACDVTAILTQSELTSPYARFTPRVSYTKNLTTNRDVSSIHLPLSYVHDLSYLAISVTYHTFRKNLLTHTWSYW